MNAPIENIRFKSLDDAVKAACDVEPVDTEKAAAVLSAYLAQDEKLYRVAHDYLINKAVRALVGEQIASFRSSLFGVRKSSGADRGRARLFAVVEEQQKTLLDYALKNFGKRLADATLSDINETAKMHRIMSAGNLAKAKWFDSIAEWMKKKGGDTVGACLDDTDLRGLAMKAGVRDI